MLRQAGGTRSSPARAPASHALDADHVVAIDNVVRLNVARRREAAAAGDRPPRPSLVGLWFSLGHSTIVLVATAALLAVATSDALRDELDRTRLRYVGAVTAIVFLYLIAAVNTVSAVQLARRRRRNKIVAAEDPQQQHSAGCLARALAPLLALVDRPYKMYAVGLLFGLGLDTALSVGLVAVSASVAQSLPVALLLFLPALFALGMVLIDTVDGILMVRLYEGPPGFLRLGGGDHPHSDSDSERTRFLFRLFMSLFSIILALTIATVGVVALVDEEYSLGLGLADVESYHLGIACVAVFVVVWGAFLVVERRGRPQRRKEVAGRDIESSESVAVASGGDDDDDADSEGTTVYPVEQV